MKRKPLTPSDRDTPTTDTTADTAEYVEKWARALVKANKTEARLVLADYRALAYTNCASYGPAVWGVLVGGRT